MGKKRPEIICMSESVTPPRKSCHLLWHVTHRCNRDCLHCLRRVPGRAQSDLSHDDCIRVLESFIQFAKASDRDASVGFSGGNPLLRDDFYDLLDRVRDYRRAGIVKRIGILGNPETLTPENVAALKAAEVDNFCLSIDGNEATNDALRGAGNYAAMRKGLRALLDAGIRTRLKFTLMRCNADQLIDVITFSLAEGAHNLGIGPLITTGGGLEIRDEALSPLEYREVLLRLVRFLDTEGPTHPAIRQHFFTQGGMFPLLYHELGRLDDYRAIADERGNGGRQPRGGGVPFFVWSDGEVVARRDMERVGWVPRDTFAEIYAHSGLLHQLEDRHALRALAQQEQAHDVTCSVCPVNDLCRPGLAGTFNSRFLFAPNRLCWRRAQVNQLR
jgi:MoaA/NifB/PqqE/SkfB family radical SAM enzyme